MSPTHLDSGIFSIAIAILLVAALIVVFNWLCPVWRWRALRRGIDRNYSTVPFITLILAVMAHSIYPYPEKQWIVVLPLIDLGNWIELWMSVTMIREWKSSRVARRNSEPSPPNINVLPGYKDETSIEQSFSGSNRSRVVITQDARGLFHIHAEEWSIEDVAAIGHGYWYNRDASLTITDTLENARKLAQEALALLP